MGAITRGFANNILSGGTIDATDGLNGTVPSSNITDSSISSVTAFPASVGDFVQSTASDPSPATLGDVWYNNATYAFKLAAVTTTGTWATGGSLNTSRQGIMGTGTQTAAIGFGGFGQFPAPTSNAAEFYNGSSWTNGPNLATAVAFGVGTGTQTAALGAGGFTSIAPQVFASTAQIYNGTSWTAITSLPSVRSDSGAAGTQTAALIFGGNTPGNVLISTTDKWNGTSWTNTGSLGTARTTMGTGTQTAALAMSGYTGASPTETTNVEAFNGSTWSPNSNTPTAVSNAGTATQGTQTAALIFGGSGFLTTTQLYNGVSWSNQGALSTGRRFLAGAGTNSSALGFGGYATGSVITDSTEEFTGAGAPVTQTITTS